MGDSGREWHRLSSWRRPLVAALMTALGFAAWLAAEVIPATPSLRSPDPAAEATGSGDRGAGGRVVIGVRADVSSFNIYTATNAFTQEVIDLLYLRLADEQDNFQSGPPTFRPSLAASWEQSPDRRALTFHLRPEVRWGSGSAVTAADILFSHRAATHPNVAWVGADVKDAITAVEAPDARTVVFRFERDSPYQLMDAVEGNVIPAAAFAAIPFPEWPKHAFLEAPSPDGPFLLKRYEPGALIELVRNPDYHRAPLPALASVVFRILPDESTLINELLSGGIDVMENVPPHAAARLESSARLRIVRAPDLSYGFVCWNTSRPLFSDPKVRRALTLAIDREAILEGLLPGVGRPSAGPILSFLWAAAPELRPLPYDPGEARRLLRENGWEDRNGDGLLDRDGATFRFDLEANQGSGLRADIAQMIAAQLRRVGIEAIPRILEFGAFVARHERHEFDAFVSSYRESTRIDLRSAFHSAAREGGYNYGLYSDAELDTLIDRARRESDAAVATDLWRRAQRIIARDQPYTFLFERDRLHAFPRSLEGVRPSPRTAYAGLEEWRWKGATASAP